MSKTTFLSSIALAAVLVSAAAPLAETVLKDKDHAKLGKLMAEYIAARQENKGISEALEDLDDGLGKVGKKLKGQSPLALPDDLGRIFWHSQEYAKKKGIKKGKVASFSVTQPWEIEYALHAPKKYNAKNAYPLVLIIPDEGEKPSDHLTEKWVLPELRDKAILVAVPMPEDTAMWGERGSPDSPGGGGNLRIVYHQVKETYAVDFDRVFLVGWGAGAAAAVQIASGSPELFAGVIGRSGDPKDTAAHNFRNLPTYFVGGGGGATAFEEAIKEAGYENCTLEADGQEAEVWAWIAEKARDANPSEIVLETGKPYPRKAYWLETPAVSDSSNVIKGAIDRESNTITIEGEGVESVTVFYNDTLVDLERPVKVICNGLEHVDMIPRNITTTLNLFWNGRSDPGKVYTATKTYDLPAPQKTSE